MTTPDSAPPRVLLADIGGTWARFALLGSHPRELQGVRRFRCAELPSLEAAIAAYLAEAPAGEGSHPAEAGAAAATAKPAAAPSGADASIPAHPPSRVRLSRVCLALPGPVDRDEIALANNPWTFSRRALEASLGVPLDLLNDFAAQAYASDVLTHQELHFAGAPRPDPAGVRVVLGPGTGLGVALRLPGGDVLSSEAGHLGFSPATDHEVELLRVLRGRFPRVSVERLVSGPGLANLYEANLVLAGGGAREGTLAGGPHLDPLDPTTPAAIAALAAQGHPVARQAVEDFFDVLASFSGDLALALWAKGGVYISGAVVRKLGAFLDEARFRARFEAKGRFEGFCRKVPVGWMRVDEPGLVGCAAHVTRLASRETGPGPVPWAP